MIRHTMNVGDTLLVHEEKKFPDLEMKARYGKDWGNYCHQKHHVEAFCRMEQPRNPYINPLYRHSKGKFGSADLQVVEIGGGFGMMRRLFHDWGLDSEYTIVDLPEFCILQRWYLESHGIFDTEWMSLDDFVWSNRRWDLLIACWSLSEIEVRPEPTFFDKAEDYLIAYQKHHDGLPFSNVDWFNKFKAEIPRTWVEEEISFLPGNLYLMGQSNG